MAECVPFPTWVPDLDNGKLEFLDAPTATFTIPNYMIRWEGDADTELDVATFEGDDYPTLTSVVSLPMIEGAREPTLHCEMTFWSNAAGTLHTNANKGWHLNHATLSAIANITTTDTNGLQTLRWTPYSGATPITFEAHVMPPTLDNAAPGRGCAVSWPIIVPDPSGLP